MSDFTYEKHDSKEKLEKYEWDNVWMDNARDTEHQHILYIGDSISCSTRRRATTLSGGELFFDGYGTSKGLDNPFFKESIALYAAQLPRLDKIIFNNGLHGFHLEDLTDYAKYYEEMVVFLLDKFKGVPLYVVLTTFVLNEARAERVRNRNKSALEVAKKYNLPVIDLYSVTADKPELFRDDGVHLTSDGYDLITEKIVDSVK